MTDPKALFRRLPGKTGLKFVTLQAAPSDVQLAVADLPPIAGSRGGLQAQATGTPTVSYAYDPVNGKLQYVFETYPDKSTTVIEYDTENKNTWSLVIFDSNSAGQLADFTSVNRDGTTSTDYYDTTVSGDPLRQADVANADGTWNATFYDTENQQAWSKLIDYYTAAAVLTNATVFLRNGNTEYQVYDTAHGDALQTDTTYGPNGAASQWVYDTADVNTWSKYLYDASGTAKVDQTFYYLSGVQEELRWDVAHGDALQYDDTYNTNGTVHEVANDTANANNWSTLITDWYTRGGQVSDQSYFERDGSSNTYFYSGSGSLTENVNLGVGGEEAIAFYNSTGSVTQVLDEQSRSILYGFLSNAGSVTMTTPGISWSNVSSSNMYYSGGQLASGQWSDSKGDYEKRAYNTDGTLKAAATGYADGTTNITVFNVASGTLSTFTADFDSSGSVRDAIETVGGPRLVTTLVTVTAAEMRQSLSTPGTTTFLEHGIKLLLVNDGSNVGGTVHSDIYWQSVSGSAQSASVHEDSIGTFAEHLLGEAIGKVVGIAVGASIGMAVGAIAGTVVGGLAGTVAGAEIGAALGGKIGGKVGSDLGGDFVNSINNSYGQSGGAAYDPSLNAPPTMAQGWSNN